MSHRVRVVDGVPRARAQRTPPPTVAQLMDKPADPRPYYGRTLPDEGIGRIPIIGVDPGEIPGSSPHKSRINR